MTRCGPCVVPTPAASPLSRSRLVLQNGGDLKEVQHELSGTPLPAPESTAL
ncbi:hypothetical protein [Streptomyces sp. c-19]|uniref:hypothetical protein n=1 Tax=Streptomyces sp. c-19 TaxID=2789275 RepID=UPI00397F6DC1